MGLVANPLSLQAAYDGDTVALYRSDHVAQSLALRKRLSD